MTLDRDGLQSWYRAAMVRRIEELRGLREGVAGADPFACDAARAVGQALRGSGATFGFPELSDVAALVEDASAGALPRRIEGLIDHLHDVVDPPGDEPTVHAEWLRLVAGVSSSGPGGFRDLESAWTDAAAAGALSRGQLAARLAQHFGLETADLAHPSRAAQRLVPEALMRSGGVLPVREDAKTIAVATGDPTSLRMELQLMRLTGRTPVFLVAPPQEIGHALSALLGSAPDARAPARRAVAESESGSERVLLVDDDASSRLLARAVLQKHGYQVVEAADGVEALESLEENQPVALVVADLNMPRMDGLELIWEMRAAERWAHVPVVVVTGETDEVLETKLIEEGADDYICKPLDPRLFLARVGATIRRAED